MHISQNNTFHRFLWQPIFFEGDAGNAILFFGGGRVVMPNPSFFRRSVSAFGSYMGMLWTNKQKWYEGRSAVMFPTLYYSSWWFQPF